MAKAKESGSENNERAGHGEIKKWFVRVLKNNDGKIGWKDLLKKFKRKYPGKQTAVIYSYFNSGIASRDRNRTVKLTRKGKSL